MYDPGDLFMGAFPRLRLRLGSALFQKNGERGGNNSKPETLRTLAEYTTDHNAVITSNVIGWIYNARA